MKRLLLVLVALGACEQSRGGEPITTRARAVEDCDLRARAGGGEYLAAVELCLRERHPHTVDAWRATIDSMQQVADSVRRVAAIAADQRLAQFARDQEIVDQVYDCWGRTPATSTFDRTTLRWIDHRWEGLAQCLRDDFRWSGSRAAQAAVAVRADIEGGTRWETVLTGGRQ